MKYFKLKTVPPIAGAETTYILKAESQKEAERIAYMKTIEDYESYGITAESEEESGFEIEYDYQIVEISKEFYDEYVVDGYEELN